MDLESYRIEILQELEVPEGCLLRFRSGDHVLWEEPFPLRRVTEAPLPSAVLERLQPGMEVHWGLFGPNGERFEAAFEIVGEDPNVEASLARLNRLLAKSPESRALLHGHLLLERGYPLAALRASTAQDCGALALRLEALRAMKALDTLLAADLRIALDARPASSRAEWLRD